MFSRVDLRNKKETCYFSNVQCVSRIRATPVSSFTTKLGQNSKTRLIFPSYPNIKSKKINESQINKMAEKMIFKKLSQYILAGMDRISYLNNSCIFHSLDEFPV